MFWLLKPGQHTVPSATQNNKIATPHLVVWVWILCWGCECGGWGRLFVVTYGSPGSVLCALSCSFASYQAGPFHNQSTVSAAGAGSAGCACDQCEWTHHTAQEPETEHRQVQTHTATGTSRCLEHVAAHAASLHSPSESSTVHLLKPHAW